MKKYANVEVNESQLEDLVRQSPDLIESGLAYVDHQASTERGPLDVLMVDSGRSLVVAELKVIEDDPMLVQGIDYYDYVSRNLDGYARAYGKHKIDPTQELRLFLIAPSFSVTMLNRVKWIEIPISLFTYQCIEFENAKGDIVPVYKEVTAPGTPERVEAYSLEDRYSYITDSKVKSLARGIVGEIQSWDSDKILVEAIKYDISIKFAGKVFAYIQPRRKHFLLSTYDPEGKWIGHPINSKSDVDAALPVVKAYYESISA